MTQESKDKIRKVLFNEVVIAVVILQAGFWAVNYITNPVQRIELDLVGIHKDIESISRAHEDYARNSNERDKAVIEIDKKLTQIFTALYNSGIIK